MSKADLTALAAQLEEHLGDPHDPGSRIPFTRVLDHDENQEYPHAFVNQLRRWGVLDHTLPAAHGARADDIETGFNLMRLVARRDVTTATALVINVLGFLPAWMGGTDEQKRSLIEEMQRGRGLSWGLTEREHGSDLLANEVVAEKVDGGYRLTGEKWLIGNATVCDKVAVHARTGKRGGPAAHSILMVDKWLLDADTVEELPVEKLHGLRALDLSGLRFKGAFVPESARIGAEGQGLELALKSGQLARAVISSFAMSATDTALRLVLDFTEVRVLMGGTVSDVPYSRRQLTESFADLMLADAVSLGAVRALQAAPEQISVWSSVVKYLVPTLLEKTMSQLNVVLGARFFLRDHPHYGMHQKMLRDLMVANFADGNTVVNLRNIGQQLGGLLTTAGGAAPEVLQASAERAATLFGMDSELPPYEPVKQEMFSRGLDDAVLAGPDAVRRLRVLAEDAKGTERDWLLKAADVAEELLGRVTSMSERSAALKAELGRDYAQSTELFELSKEYCLLHATAACVLTFVHSHDALEDPLPSGALLLLQMERLRKHLYPYESVTDQVVIDEVMRVLRHLHRENLLFSHWQFPLAERTVDAAATRL
ncbi:acyl-CoA dehydrogenase family protein [Streptomyces sp. NBC_01481]|uniref:acyl-CoA dehydrogenase family protein n=1 Tax=Streptomyces sp. NBC_01481 TaxID=2975869 RepID=UPI0022522C0B|nr:acyl-CoA dehydrogenase family protein [Streptomyces sp. NBC_01481]MCX4582491.1 acyl-CoA dehydrogenase family protein [Streptomyces sp. NBC_01481]